MIKIVIKISVSIIIILIVFFILISNGIIKFNNPNISKFPIRGVDVSAYQGNIDWKVIENQNIKFAFIKATEGSSYVDEFFVKNWNNASLTNLKIGAYHFLSYDSRGKNQAENFIKTVPIMYESLPPVVDVEFYGDKYKNNPSKEQVKEILDEFIFEIEKNYQKKPIIYTTMKAYTLYIKDDYNEYCIWIRDIFKEPKLPDGKKWTFWQYTDKGKIDGYSGNEKFIDMNVFYGSEQEFERFILEQNIK